MRKVFLITTIVLTIAGVICALLVLIVRTLQVNNISMTMPPVVPESMDTLLLSLESELEKQRPDIISSLQPGITLEELQQAEQTLGQTLHPEMQTIYRWHNGLATDKEFFPGHGFWSLQEAIRTNQELTAQYREKGMSLFMAREKNWLILFPDGAGDGYYYDPKRSYEMGGIFYNFREVRYYRYFPSAKNLVRAILECYRNGAYPRDTDPDFEIEEQIMNKYGVGIQE